MMILDGGHCVGWDDPTTWKKSGNLHWRARAGKGGLGWSSLAGLVDKPNDTRLDGNEILSNG